MVAVRSLSESDLAAVRGELGAGKQPTVWFTPVAVGVPVGGSAKVVSVGEVPEGEFIQVRPAGSRDVMFCSPGELTMVRTPRRRKVQAEAPEPLTTDSQKPTAVPEKSVPQSMVPQSTVPKSTVPKSTVPKSTVPKSTVLKSTVPQGQSAAVTRPAGPAAKADTPQAARRSAERRSTSAEVTVTLFATAEGEWTVEVTVGKKRVVRSMPVQPAEVAKAARSLPAPVTEAIEASLAAARKRQTERVEQLRAELEAAQQALRELSG